MSHLYQDRIGTLYTEAEELHRATWTYCLHAHSYENVASHPDTLTKMQRKLDEIEAKCIEARKRLQEASA